NWDSAGHRCLYVMAVATVVSRGEWKGQRKLRCSNSKPYDCLHCGLWRTDLPEPLGELNEDSGHCGDGVGYGCGRMCAADRAVEPFGIISMDRAETDAMQGVWDVFR